jgi:hypothetical protein
LDSGGDGTRPPHTQYWRLEVTSQPLLLGSCSEIKKVRRRRRMAD